jgi:hypothetical protein
MENGNAVGQLPATVLIDRCPDVGLVKLRETRQTALWKYATGRHEAALRISQTRQTGQAAKSVSCGGAGSVGKGAASVTAATALDL